MPEADGKLLYDVVVRNRFTRALEIGSSTGHSGIWIAWALSKTGGKLITVDNDASRHQMAVENFRKAGLAEYIDARQADAHDLVPKLPGPFDFVFSDADKEGYRSYFDAVTAKLLPGGCYVTHNVSDRRDTGFDVGDYVAYLKGLPGFETTFDDRGAGISITCRKTRR